MWNKVVETIVDSREVFICIEKDKGMIFVIYGRNLKQLNIKAELVQNIDYDELIATKKLHRRTISDILRLDSICFKNTH